MELSSLFQKYDIQDFMTVMHSVKQWLEDKESVSLFGKN